MRVWLLGCYDLLFGWAEMNWKKVIGWTALCSLALIVVAATAFYFVQRSQTFHHWVIGELQTAVQQKSGAHLQIHSYSINWPELSVTVHGVVLRGKGPQDEKPLLTVDDLTAQLKIISLLNRKFALNKLLIDHPVANIQIGANRQSNLPTVPHPSSSSSPSPSTSSFNPFSIAVGRLSIASGDIYYNDREIPLNLQVHDFQAQAVYSATKIEYTGSLSCAGGTVQFKSYTPISSGFQTHFTASRSQIVLSPAILNSDHSRVQLSATIINYSSPEITGSYQAVIDTSDLRNILRQPALPSGEVAMNGSFGYAGSKTGTFLDNLLFTAQLNSPNLAVTASREMKDIQNVSGRIDLQNGNLQIHDLAGRVFNGNLNVDGEMRNLSGTPVSHMTASLQNISLSALAHFAPTPGIKQIPITGRLDARANAMWRGPIRDVRANVDANLHVAIAPLSGSSRTNGHIQPMPVNAAFHVIYDGARGTVSFSNSSLRMPDTTLQLNGTMSGIINSSTRSNLALQLHTGDLAELARIATVAESVTRNGGIRFAPQLATLHGSLSLNAQVHGSLTSPQVNAELVANDLQVQGTKWRVLRSDLALSPSNLRLSGGELEAAGPGSVSFAATAALHHWSFEESAPITLQASANHMSIAQLQQLADLHYPVSGNLTLRISVHGSVANPAGQGNIQVTDATVEKEKVQSLQAQFQGTGKDVQAQIGLKLPAGDVAVRANYAIDTRMYSFQLGTMGIKLQDLQHVQNRNLGLMGTVVASFTGSGTVQQPQLAGKLSIQQFQIGGQSIQQFQAQLSLTNRMAQLALNSEIADASLNAKGTVDLTGEYPTVISVDTQPFPIGAMLARFAPGTATGLQGQAEIHAMLKGPLKHPADLQASVEIPTFSLAYQSIQLAESQPIRMIYQNGAVTISPAELKGTDTDIHFQGFVPIRTAQPLSVSANGTVDLAVLRLFDSNVNSSGRIDLNLSAKGALRQPEASGQIKVVNAALTEPSLPVGVNNLNGTLQLSGERVTIAEMHGSVGGGDFSAQGFASLRPLAFNLGVTAGDMRILYPQGVRTVLSAKLSLAGDASSSTASGTVLLDRLSFTRNFDLASMMGQFSGPSVSTAASPLEQNMKLNIAVQSADQLSAESGTLTIQGAANLRISGTAANPIVLGRATLSGGEVYFLGNTYKIQSGVIDFANPVRINPTVNLYVSTTVDQYDITLNFIGPVDQIRTTYLANPSLPPVDIIHLLAFGETTEQASSSPATPASLGAESFLASAATGRVTSSLQTLTGISQISISPGIGGNTPNTGTTISIRERISGKLTFSATTNVTQTQQEILSLQYQLKPKIGISVTRDQNGGFAIQAQIHSQF